MFWRLSLRVAPSFAYPFGTAALGAMLLFARCT